MTAIYWFLMFWRFFDFRLFFSRFNTLAFRGGSTACSRYKINFFPNPKENFSRDIWFAFSVLVFESLNCQNEWKSSKRMQILFQCGVAGMGILIYLLALPVLLSKRLKSVFNCLLTMLLVMETLFILFTCLETFRKFRMVRMALDIIKILKGSLTFDNF